MKFHGPESNGGPEAQMGQKRAFWRAKLDTISKMIAAATADDAAQGLSPKEIADFDLEIPPLTPETLAELGVEIMSAVRDEALTGAFRKEGRSEAGNQFMVVKDEQGIAWLLKSVNYPYDQPDRPAESMDWWNKSRFVELELLQKSQKEVFAARVGNAIDYPLAETKLVTFDGRTWTALRHLEGVRETTEQETWAVPRTNRDDELSRPMFNALIGAHGDAAFQGLIDPRGKYYAHDTSVLFLPYVDSMDPLVLEEYLFDNLKLDDKKEAELQTQGSETYIFCRFDPFNQDERRAGESFVRKLESLTIQRSEEIFRDFMGSQEEQAYYARHLTLRARVLAQVFARLVK